MKSIRLLNQSLDSIGRLRDSLTKRMLTDLNTYIHYGNVNDSFWKKAVAVKAKPGSFDKLLPDSARLQVYESALNTASFLRTALQNVSSEIGIKKSDIKFHKLEWHRKFSLSLACLVLFFIGAPLGSIIRKGGLGMPLVVAIVFFLIFHLLNMFGEKFVKEEITTPFAGMWLAIFVLIPVGIFLTYKAMHDSQLFNKEFYSRFFKKFSPIIATFKRGKKSVNA